MMIRSKIIVCLVTLLFFVSCKKKELNFSIEGSISDLTLNSNLVGAKISIFQLSLGSTSPTEALDEMIVGNDGRYSFIFPREKAEAYLIKIEKENYFSIEETIPFSSFSTEKTLEKNFSTTAKAWVKIRFVNQSPALSGDILKYIKMNGKSNCSECCSNTEQFLYGVVDSTITCINDGNTNYSFYHWIINTPTQEQHSIYTPAFDTVTYTLAY